MSASAVSTKRPQLYTELYMLIIEFITDSSYLPRVWLNFRQVSREFKAITELVFARKHLPHALIVFPSITGTVYDVDDDKHQLSLALEFQKLTGDNDERAVFSEDRYYYNDSSKTRLSENGRTLLTEITEQWKHYFYGYSLPTPDMAFSTSPHVLSVRRVANDTALPGLEVNWEEHTISVSWKEMLSALFGEEEYIERLKKNDIREGREDVRPSEEKAKELRELFEAGDNEPIIEFMNSVANHANEMDNKRRQMARRERFRRWYKTHKGLTAEEADGQPRNSNKAKVLQDYRGSLFWDEYDDEWGLESSDGSV
ncbi:hypothetical protein F5Y07DRAFT_398592 [Xylaria sp. FL0933]|nr:hypothetical protein F5Y07DRAFT_398592 [Xylaria sp. FL0933]